MNRLYLNLLGLALSGAVWGAEPVTYNLQAFSTNDPIDSLSAEAAFLDAAGAGGFSTFTEDFESPVWDMTRSPNSAESILSQGITWHSSSGNRLTTTSDSDSYEVPPPFMIFTRDPASGLHAVPNTLFGESANKLYGVGFWADGTGTKGKIKVILDDAVEVKFQRVTGYEHNPPDPPEPIKVTMRLTYEKEFHGVYAPDGFNKFQLLEFAGEFDEVVLMWMRTFTFAYKPLVPTGDIQLTDIDYGDSNLQIEFTSTPAYSNFTLQANRSPFEPLAWRNVTNNPTLISQDYYRFTVPLPVESNGVFRIISTP